MNKLLRVLVVLSAVGCENKVSEAPVVSSDSAVGMPEQPDSVSTADGSKFGSIVGVEATSFECIRTPFQSSDEDFERVLGVSRSEIVARMEGAYSTNFRTGVLSRISGLPEGEEGLGISIGDISGGRVHENCGNLVEFDALMQMRSASLGLISEGRTTVVSSDLGVTVDISGRLPATAGGWAGELDKRVSSPVQQFEFSARVADGITRGEVYVQGVGSSCRLFLWPEERVCSVTEIEIDGGEVYRGVKAKDLLDEWAKQSVTPFRWDGEDSDTELSMEFTANGAAACVREARNAKDIFYEIPGEVSLTTLDGRLNVTVDARLRAAGSDDTWTRLSVATDGRAVARAGKVESAPGFGQAPNDRAVVLFESPGEPVVVGSDLAVGSLEVLLMEGVAEELVPESSRCTAGQLLGNITSQASGGFRIVR